MLDNDKIKDFASKYGIYDFQIKSSYEHLSTVSFEMALGGFELLVADANGVRASEVALPNDIELMTMSTEELERIKDYIGDLILCSDFDGIVKAQKQISSARS